MKLIDTKKTMVHKNRILVNSGCPLNFINYCENILSVLKNKGYESVYARVDGINVNGEFVLMELELIEPNLHFNISNLASRDYFESIYNFIDNNNNNNK